MGAYTFAICGASCGDPACLLIQTADTVLNSNFPPRGALGVPVSLEAVLDADRAGTHARCVNNNDEDHLSP